MRVVMCILIISFTVIFGMSCERHMEQQVSYTEADSLNHLAYDMRYKDLSVAMKAAKRACQLAEGNSDLRFVPLCAWILKRLLLCIYRL